MKYKINFSPTGLGDRIKYSIKSIPYLINKDKNLKIYAYWKKNRQCHAEFEDLFENVYNIKFIKTPFSKQEISDNIKEISEKLSLGSQRLHHHKFPNENAQKVLKLKREIQSEVLDLQKKYSVNKSVIGIHLRVPENFDFKNPKETLNKFPQYANGRACSLMSNLKKIKESKILKKYKVLLFSDNQELIDRMLVEYDNFFTIPECTEIPVDLNLGIGCVIRNKDSVVSAIKSAALLSLCDYNDTVKLALTSNFSKIPMWIKI